MPTEGVVTVCWEPLGFQFSRLPYNLTAGTRETHLEHEIAGDPELTELSTLCISRGHRACEGDASHPGVGA